MDPHNMEQFDEYQKLAQVTKAPSDTPEVKERARKAMPALVRALHAVAHQAEWMDEIKKYIYYDKASNRIQDTIGADASVNKAVHTTTKHEVAVEMLDVPHGIIGVITEAGELAEALLDFILTGDLDAVNVAEEFGDVLWYLAIGSEAMGTCLSDVAGLNITKLAQRYPEGFAERSAKIRDLMKERKVLEGPPNAGSGEAT